MSASPDGDPPSPEDALRVSLETAEGWLAVAAAGEVDLLTVPVLDDAVTAALARRPARLVIDLTEVTFLDSTGLSALAQAHTAASTGTEVRVVAPADGMPHRAIVLTGLHETLAVFSTRSDAVTSH